MKDTTARQDIKQVTEHLISVERLARQLAVRIGVLDRKIGYEIKEGALVETSLGAGFVRQHLNDAVLVSIDGDDYLVEKEDVRLVDISTLLNLYGRWLKDCDEKVSSIESVLAGPVFDCINALAERVGKLEAAQHSKKNEVAKSSPKKR